MTGKGQPFQFTGTLFSRNLAGRRYESRKNTQDGHFIKPFHALVIDK